MKTLVTVVLILFICESCLCQAEEQQRLTTVTVASDTTLLPFSGFMEGLGYVGFDIDFLQAVSELVSFRWQIVDAAWDDMFKLVKDNQVDLAVSAITITDDRKAIYDFSVPYFLTIHKILALNGTDIRSAQDLIGKTVAVRNETTGIAAVEKIYGGDNPNILIFANSIDAVEAVQDGKADVYVDDSAILEWAADEYSDFIVISDPGAFDYEFYGFMFPKGSEWLAPFNTAITTLLENGDYNITYWNYFRVSANAELLLRAGKLEDPYDALEEDFGEEMEMSL